MQQRIILFLSRFASSRLARMVLTIKSGNSSSESGRGTLIIMEGCDRTGKTTQAKMLVDNLVAAGKPTMFMRFPGKPRGSCMQTGVDILQEKLEK